MSENFNNSFYFTNYTNNLQYTFYYYFYVHPVSVLLAVFSNTVCAVVFAQKDLLSSGAFFQYSLVNSVLAAIGMAAIFPVFLARCGPICGQAYTYWSQVYELYGVVFLTNSIYCSSSLIQISISSQLYFSITQRFNRLSTVSPIKVTVAVVLAGFAQGLMMLFSFEITENSFLTISNGTEKWDTLYFALLDTKKPLLVQISILSQLVLNTLFIVILVILNFLLYGELKMILKKKAKLTKSNVSASKKVYFYTVDNKVGPIGIVEGKNSNSHNNKNSKKSTLIMVLWVSVIFSSSRLVYLLNHLIIILMDNTMYRWWSAAFNLFYNSCVYLSYFFVYIKTNKIFRKKFYKIFLRRDVN